MARTPGSTAVELNKAAAWLAAGTVVLGTALVGCSSTSGEAQPAGQPSNAPQNTSSQIAGKPAPKVTTPLDPAKFIADPCAVLTEQQKAKFQVTGEPRRGNASNGDASCTWTTGGTVPATVGINFDQSTGDGLQRLYDLDASKQWVDGYFEPTDVGGYPAAYVGVADTRPSGDCTLTVGVSDQLVFATDVFGEPGTDGCKATKTVASAMLDTIKAG